MDLSHTPTVRAHATPAADPQMAMAADGQPRPSCLTHGQRWLACATAIAVLLSGLNASVQVLKAVSDRCNPPVAQRPHPGLTRKLLHKDHLASGPERFGLGQAGPDAVKAEEATYYVLSMFSSPRYVGP